MKNWTANMIKGLLVTGLVLSMTGCGNASEPAAAEPESTAEASAAADTTAAAAEVKADGKYTSIGMRKDEYIIAADSAVGLTLELKEDGTGYLNFAADNQGPISSWSADNGKFTMKAGVSDFTGVLKDGVLDLDIGDDFVIVFVQDGAKQPDGNIVTLEEYKKLREEKAGSVGASDKTKAGEYIIYAIESGGSCVKLPEEEDTVFIFTLNEDGTGKVTVDEESEPILWSVDGDRLEVFETDGTSAMGKYGMTIDKGILTLTVPGENGADDVIEYFVRKDADLESIGAVDISERNG